MKKTLLLLSFISFFFFQKADAQGSFIQNTTYSPTMPLACQDLIYNIDVQNNCNNYIFNGITHTVTGFNIEISIDYTVGFICLGALQYIQYNYNVGMLPSGTYTVTTRTILNASVQDTDIKTVPIGTCCTAESSFTSSKPFGCVADVDSFTFTNTSTSTANMWYVNGVLSATTTNFTTPLNTIGTQSIKLVTSDASCSDSVTHTFEIYDNPIVNLGNIVNACVGIPEVLTAPSGYASYLWNTNSASESITVSMDGDYDVIVTNSDGCKTFDTVTVVSYTQPTPDLGNDIIICEGDVVTLDPGNYSAYLWNPFASTPTIDVIYGFQYSVRVTDGNGCYGYDTVLVTVNNAPSISFPSDTVEICAGETATLMSPGTYDSYAWSTTETTTSIDVTTENNYTLSVTNNGCSNSDEVYLKVNALPIVDLGMDTAQNCAGSSVTLDAGTFTSYVWSTTETSATINVMTQGVYSVNVTDANNCTGMDDVYVNVNNLPVVDLGADQNLCTDEKIVLDAGTFVSYLWDDASVGSTIELNGATLPLGAKTVTVDVTDVNACVGSDEVIITVLECANAISDVELENSISINPNPALDHLFISSEKYDNFKVSIYSTLGELVLSIENMDTSNKIDISNLNTGIYFMNITVDNKRLVKQFVKTK